MAAPESSTATATESIIDAFQTLGYEMPAGLAHIVLHTGSNRKEVYRGLWGSLMYVGKLNTGGQRTLVYPEEVRETVRLRFGNPPDAGAYDRQYLDQGYHVSMEELAKAKWREAPAKCRACQELKKKK